MKRRAPSLHATGDPRDTPHAARAVLGCGCIQCHAHRRYERRDEGARRQIAAAENEPITGDVMWHDHQLGRGSR